MSLWLQGPKENKKLSNAATRKGFLSFDCSAQMGEQYYLKWGGPKQEVKWKAISWWICLIPFSFKRGCSTLFLSFLFFLCFISHNCNIYGSEDVLWQKKKKKKYMGHCHCESCIKSSRENEIIHISYLLIRVKSHSEETGNETRKQVPELFLHV